MSLKYIPPDAPFLITSTGVLFAPKSIYKTPLSCITELCRILTASFLLIPPLPPPTPAPPKYICNQLLLQLILQCFLIHKQSSIHFDIYYEHAVQI